MTISPRLLLQAGWGTQLAPALATLRTYVLVVLALSSSAASAFAPPPLAIRTLPPRAAQSSNYPCPGNARMTVLEKGSSLPDLGSAGFTLSTYNVLLPNSNDGLQKS